MAENEIIEAQSTIAHSHTQHYNPVLTLIEPESNLKTLLDAMAFE
jgi:hypothetical protein